MDMSKAIGDLLEYEFSVRLLQLAFALDEPEKITTSSILHDHEQVLA